VKIDSYIYFMFDPKNNHGYVGKSVCPEERIKGHWRCRKSRSNYKDNWLCTLSSPPEFVILKRCTQRSWQKWERYYITKMKREGWKLTNLTSGGEGVVGYEFTEEHKRKLSEIRLGIKLSEETRSKMKGRTPWNKGKSLSAEHCKNLSVSHRGQVSPMKNRKHRKESRDKMRESHAGKTLTVEHRRNQSISVRRAWAQGKYENRRIRCT